MNHRKKKVVPQLILCPLYDHNLSIIGYEPAMRSKDVILCMESFSDVERIGDFDITGVNRLFWECAFESYTGELPLFLHRTTNLLATLTDRFWDLDVIPKGRKVVLLVQPDHFYSKGTGLLHHIEKFAECGVQLAIDDFGVSRLSAPMLFQLKPKYIRLAKEALEACTDAVKLKELSELLQPFKAKGIQIIAADIESQEMFDQARSIADIFQGDWLIRSHSMLQPSLSK